MRGKVCLITGATSGIGQATAHALAQQGATVLLVARDPARGEATRAAIQAASGNDAVAVLLADLSSQASIRSLAAEVVARYPRLDVLVNNAGGLNGARTLTVDGLELTFAVNHLAYFLLTNLLLDTLKASAPSRIVNVTSEAQSNGRIHFDDLQGERGYSSMRAYSQSKLANILFTYELARRLAGTGVTANCVHPGVVRTGYGATGPAWMRGVIVAARPFMRTPEKGAETVVYLASAPEVEGVTGKYFADKRERRSSAVSYDPAVAARLWQVSEQLTKS